MKSGKIAKTLALIAVLSVTLVAVAAAGAATVLHNWRPLRESGSAPAPSQSSGEEKWQGDFTDILICGIDNTNSLTDVILVAAFDNKNKKVNILQIPRDTYAGEDVPSGKYNAVYGHHPKDVSGMETLKAKIERDFGIELSHYAAVSTKGLRALVDAAGGVDLDVPINMNYDDDAQDLHIHLKKGEQHLDGAQAEQFVRYRKGWIEGDIGRLNAQRIFLAAFTQKLRSMSVWSLGTRVVPVISAPDFLTDMSGSDMLGLWNAASTVSLENAKITIVPGEPFKGENGEDLYSVHRDDLLKVLNDGFVPDGVTLSGGDLSIIEMANAYKTSSRADNLQDALNKSTSSK